MKKQLMVISLVFLLCLTFCCQKPVEEAAEEAAALVKTLSDADVAAINASIEAYNQAVASTDWTAAAALYTEDAVLMLPNQPAIHSREAILTWMKAFPPLTDFNLAAEEIDARGDLAFVRGTLSMTIVPEGAPEPIQDTLKYVEIRRKQEDGSWLIAVDIFNSDMPLPPPSKQE
ncbi:MAG: SgcJ/EcaC family oxidoreductase [Candidatus Aminicenantes bacterium]|nr:SgcJ/EcaC family oxidoreductase [Candidatus Aminicenantes bacterium]